MEQIGNNEYLGMKFISVGGMGANLCAKLIGKLAVSKLSLNACSFASYGSEKTGAKMYAYVRWTDKEREIYKVTPVIKPDIIALFDEKLIQDNENLKAKVIIINSSKTSKKLREQYELDNPKVVSVDCNKIAANNNSRINMVMFGAILKMTTAVTEEIITDFLQKEMADSVKAAKEGYENTDVDCDIKNVRKTNNEADQLKREGYLNMLPGGIIKNPGNMVVCEHSMSRNGYIPVYDANKCINCGLCDITCPDMVFNFEMGEYKGKRKMLFGGIDYAHCKGCLRCVEICPTHALTAQTDCIENMTFNVKNSDLMVEQVIYEKEGSNPYVTEQQ